MIIKDAKFTISNTDVSKCPQSNLPEYAFIGRSNVGKSLLINMLTQRSKLAMTSSHPGKTKLINHFMINEEWFLVDLPGYGYAKEGKSSRDSFGKIITEYMLGRVQLTCVFVLVDVRHKPQQVDIDFINWLGEEGIPLSIIFTKADKLSKSAAFQNVESFKAALSEFWEDLPPYFLTSSTKRQGRDEVLEYIGSINENLA